MSSSTGSNIVNFGKKLKIGIGIPCLESDRDYLPTCMKGVNELKNYGHDVINYIDINDGKEGLKVVRKRIFNKLFDERSCDVVLQCDVDFFLMDEILRYIEKDRLVTFTFMKRKVSTFIELIKFLISPNTWTGCYSIPRDIWKDIENKDAFDGNDTSVHRYCDSSRIKIKRVRLPKYWVLRPSQKYSEERDFIKSLPFIKRITKMFSWW